MIKMHKNSIVDQPLFEIICSGLVSDSNDETGTNSGKRIAIVIKITQIFSTMLVENSYTIIAMAHGNPRPGWLSKSRKCGVRSIRPPRPNLK